MSFFHSWSGYYPWENDPPSLTFLKMFILCVWLFCLYLCMDTMWVPVTLGGQKKALDFSELGFKRVLNHQSSGLWDLNQILCKSNKCSWRPNHLSSPSSLIYLMCVSMCACVCERGTLVPWHVCGARGYVVGVSSLLPSRGFWGSDSGCQVCWEILLPTDHLTSSSYPL